MPIDLLAQSAALFCPNAVLSELNRHAVPNNHFHQSNDTQYCLSSG